MNHLGLLVVLLSLGCGPHVAESRMAFYPAREESCALEFVQGNAMTIGTPGSPWEVIGFVVVSETGIADPFSAEYRSIVGPRACRMGGEGVAILQSATNEHAMGSGSGTTYGVLRHKKL